MRFIGNKENLVEKIFQILQNKDIVGNLFFDFFAGTSNVGQFFKKKGYQVFSSDLLYFSFVLQKAYIENNEVPTFEKLLSKTDIKTHSLFASPLMQIVDFLNTIPQQEGFIFQNYTPEGTKDLDIPRMYFSNENGKIIDAIRLQIETWKNENLLTENEYYILLACLIETVPFYANISGVYAAFQKKWDARAVKKMILRPIEIIVSNKENKVFNQNSVELISKIQADILYLDPPYNQRQYAPNYHLLETIAKYDNPSIKGVSGMRNYENQKSQFCNAESGLKELYNIAKNANYKKLILSYNSEGIMTQDKVLSVLGSFGEVELVEFDYLRFKSNSNGESKTKKFIQEQLYILRKF
ncbi:DNA adenine methylase [Hugenholtzia roseola]|uniref:DNA adenine methylase n=1 Tax=Hugenholtzia roseola TaxID=1002 RepID=UPI0003FC02DA|nr:DNA adenine methylase [Hugenholtzia roseola]